MTDDSTYLPAADEPADDRAWSPARVAPVSGQIVAQVRHALFAGELKPGQFLGSESQLAERFGASRGTIRTVLSTLEALGMIDIKAGAGGGVRVAEGNPDRFADALAVQFRLVGVSHSALLERPDPSAFTITRITVDFKRAARIDDALLVRTTYDAAKGPRLFISQRITRGEELIATASVEAACIDLKGRARKPPPGLAEALAPLFTPPP